MEKIKTLRDHVFAPQYYFETMLRLIGKYPMEAYFSDLYHDIEMLAFIFGGKYSSDYYWIIRKSGTNFIPIIDFNKMGLKMEYIAKFQFNFDFKNQSGEISFIDHGNQFKG